uniref:BTB domain-containing protein n=1 Tax=Clytia hemisphaerica TaxID=252671 RepID=A0A7M5V7H7_9CNID
MEKSPEKMNKDQHEVKEDLKSESKPLETINPFDCQENNADSLVKIRTKDQKVILIDHMMLLFISDAFENIIENEEGQKFIDASEFSPENIVQAISFHLPRFNGKLNDKCDFAGLLSICSKWSLSNYRNHIEEYLLTQHKAGIEKFNGCLQPQHLDILHLADRFQLEKILTKLMSNLSSIGFEYSTNIKVSLEKLNREIKYEILKTLIVGKATRESMAASVSMELDCIFNFLDLLIFEDRVLDMYAKNKFKDFASHKEYLIYSKLRKEDFTAKQRSSDVKLVVNGDELFVNPYILSNNSPVLKDMLVKAGKENDGDCLNLLWKSTDEIVLLLTFLTKSMELNGDCDLYTLASLCEEYKIEWLMSKIEKFVQYLDISKLSAK